MRYILLIAILFIAGCASNDYEDKSTGKKYSEKEWNNLPAVERDAIIERNQEANKDESFIGRLLGAKIIFLYAAGALLCVLGGIVCMMSKPAPNLMGAAACGAGALACALLPACIALFWKAGMIILYVSGAFLIIIAVIAAYFFYRKLKSKHDSEISQKQLALEGVVGTVEELKSAFPENWQEFRGMAKQIQCDTTKEAVKQVKANGGSK